MVGLDLDCPREVRNGGLAFPQPVQRVCAQYVAMGPRQWGYTAPAIGQSECGGDVSFHQSSSAEKFQRLMVPFFEDFEVARHLAQRSRSRSDV
jgi:hypothetical protein